MCHFGLIGQIGNTLLFAILGGAVEGIAQREQQKKESRPVRVCSSLHTSATILFLG